MKITHETRRESYEQLDPSGRKAAILAELERGDGTALEIMRRMGFTDPNRVRPRLNELDRAGYIFQVGKRRDPYAEAEPVSYCPECGAPVYDGERIYYGHGTDHVIGCEHCIDTGFAQAG